MWRPTTFPRFPAAIRFCLPALIVALGTAGESAADGYDCLTTPNNIPRKVIIKTKDLVIVNESTGREQPLRFFRKYFVFKESRRGYLVGEATVESSILGWVRKEDVLPWNTEQAIFFINKNAKGREPVRVWQSKDDIGRPGKPCFEESLDTEHTTEPFPILEKEGDTIKVAFLWNRDTPVPAIKQNLEEGGGNAYLTAGDSVDRGSKGKHLSFGRGKFEHIVEQTRMMDIVLVMDVTGSMQKYMDQVQLHLKKIVQLVTDMNPAGPAVKIRVGVVAYRDYVDASTTFVTKSLDLTPHPQEATQFLSKLTAGGGQYSNEAVCEALHRACEDIKWGEHSFRVICLVTDAPPHTADDRDTRELKQAGAFVASPYFACEFEDNLKRVKELLEKKRIRLYSLGVGDDPEAKSMLRRFVDEPSRSLSLDDERAFIVTLAQELKSSRQAHDRALADFDRARNPSRPISSLTNEEFESLQILNVDPEKLVEMRSELIQTGWFKPKVGDSAAVCVYMRRRDLEQWATQLREQLLVFREKQQDIFVGIAQNNVGKDLNVRGIGELIRMFDDVAYTPEILRLENLGLEDQVKVRKLRTKLNNIEILLLTENLFSEYEEGWVPMEYLPGALSDLRSTSR